MPTLSIGENFMRLVNKQVPEYVPTYNLFWAVNSPPVLMGERNPDGTGRDIWGVESAVDSGGINPPMPKTHDFILTDITKWRDVIKAPDLKLDQSAWEAMAKEAHDRRDPELPFGGGTSMGFFQPLVAFMGFTDGLAACFEEPEEVKALMEYICDFSVGLAKDYIHYYKPEFGFLGDDIAHERNPFLSLEMFQDLIAPYWRRYYKVFTDAGLHCGHHNCGHFELYLDDLVDMGVTFWDPVQSSNDEDAIKAKYGNNLGLCGMPDTRFWTADTTEEQVRHELRSYVDRLAPGGGYAMMHMIYGEPMPGTPPQQPQRYAWMRDEFEKIRYSYYN